MFMLRIPTLFSSKCKVSKNAFNSVFMLICLPCLSFFFSQILLLLFLTLACLVAEVMLLLFPFSPFLFLVL